MASHATAAAARHAAGARVAVIGAGAAGLAAAKELEAEGHTPVLFEAARDVGGVWVYSPATDADPLGSSDPRHRHHGSMYRDLRTNLPREIMSFCDFPFVPAAMGGASTDPRRFPSHDEVLAYLQCYAAHYQLKRHVLFGARVLRAAPLWRRGAPSAAEGGGDADADADAPLRGAESGPQWEVTYELEEGGSGRRETQREVFDALVVANGHYSATNLPDVEGADAFPGLQMHSHNYRVPEPFTGQTVLVVGASNSGEDLCRELAVVADRVIVCARSWKNPAWATDFSPFGPRGNISRRGMVTRLTAGGGAEFAAGPVVARVDAVIYATGYRYEFPFLADLIDSSSGSVSGSSGSGSGSGSSTKDKPAARLSTADQHVSPLFQHLYFPPLAPTLAFIGLTWKVVPFPMFELQSRLVARVLSGAAALPSHAQMSSEADAFYARLRAEGVPPRWTHMMDAKQWPYNEWLAEAAGAADRKLGGWREAMYRATGLSRRAHPNGYRDEWDDEEAAAEAGRELARLAEGVKAKAAGGSGGGGGGGAPASASAAAAAAASV